MCIMVGVDTKVDGNNAKWIVGAAGLPLKVI